MPGKGKTISVVEKLDRLKLDFPNIKIVTNFGYYAEDEPLTGWQQLIDINNGENGVVFVIDEVQLTFSSRDWGNFPVEILTLLTQNRKQRKLILATAQSYDRVDKIFRELTNYVIRCNTFLGRWTVNRAFLKEEYELFRQTYGQVKKAMTSWRYTYIQTDELRTHYDTYKILTKMERDALTGEMITLEDTRKLAISEPTSVFVNFPPKTRK